MDSSHTHTTISGPQPPTKVPGLLRYAEQHPRTTTFLHTYNTPIKALTGVAFLGHFLRIRSAVDAHDAALAANTISPSAAKNFSPIRRAGVAGLAWSVVWFGVLSATTLAQESVHRRGDPVAIHRTTRAPWNVGLGDKEEI